MGVSLLASINALASREGGDDAVRREFRMKRLMPVLAGMTVAAIRKVAVQVRETLEIETQCGVGDKRR